MTKHSSTSRRIRGLPFGGRGALLGGLSLALLAAGLTGTALASTTDAHDQTAAVSLAAATKTLVGTYTNAQATITVNKAAMGSGTELVVGYIADITVTDATALKSAFAKNTVGKNVTETVSTMAKNNKAVLAINTDYYGFRDTGIVIRNGVSYRDKPARQGLGILRDGGFMLYDESKYTAAKLIAAKVWQGLSFGPSLVENGKVLSGIDTYEIGDFGEVTPGGFGSIQGLQPRTGIGLIDKNHFLMIVVSGRNADGSRGMTMPEFAQMFVDAGATTAFNLDGGGSSTMYFKGAIVNSPAFGTERATSDILYLAE